MSKPALGTKRVCPSCAAKFYDLSRSPVECPKCGHTYVPEDEPKEGNVKPSVNEPSDDRRGNVVPVEALSRYDFRELRAYLGNVSLQGKG